MVFSAVSSQCLSDICSLIQLNFCCSSLLCIVSINITIKKSVHLSVYTKCTVNHHKNIDGNFLWVHWLGEMCSSMKDPHSIQFPHTSPFPVPSQNPHSENLLRLWIFREKFLRKLSLEILQLSPSFYKKGEFILQYDMI